MNTLADLIKHHRDQGSAARTGMRFAKERGFVAVAAKEQRRLIEHDGAICTLQDVQKLYDRMRNVAVNYANVCGETRSVRPLDSEFKAIEAAMRTLKGMP